MRMILRFGKEDRLRFISHLDLQRFFQRALSRSGLPVAYTQGFNPHPVMAFASALALGWTSDYEVLDVRLSVPLGKARLRAAMEGSLPPDLPILELTTVEDRAPSLMPLVVASSYEIRSSLILREHLHRFLESDHVTAVKKTKSGEHEIDLKPLVSDISLRDGVLYATCSLTEKDTLKPDLLVTAMCGERPADLRIRRKELLAGGPDGCPVPLMQVL